MKISGIEDEHPKDTLNVETTKEGDTLRFIL